MRYVNQDGALVYDEENSFFIFMHILEVLGYKSMYDNNLSKV